MHVLVKSALLVKYDNPNTFRTSNKQINKQTNKHLSNVTILYVFTNYCRSEEGLYTVSRNPVVKSYLSVDKILLSTMSVKH